MPQLALWKCLSRRWETGIGLALVVVLAVGCSPAEYGHVTGKVMLDGKPVESAEIRFAPESGRAAWDRTEADGSYELNYTPGVRGAKTGTNTVTITTATEPTVDDQGRTVPGQPELFPAEYSTAPTHKVEVVPGENVFDFDVKSGG
jgi:hypothetical protein